jgi:hypothetical protein
VILNKNEIRGNDGKFNDSSIDMNIDESIKSLLKNEDNKINLKKFLQISNINITQINNATSIPVNNLNQNPPVDFSSSPSSNIDQIKSQSVDPYELTLKVMKFKELEEKNEKENEKLYNYYKKEVLTKTGISKDNIIFDHIFINSKGDKSLSSSQNEWVYDHNQNEFHVPEEGKIRYKINLKK